MNFCALSLPVKETRTYQRLSSDRKLGVAAMAAVTQATVAATAQALTVPDLIATSFFLIAIFAAADSYHDDTLDAKN
jgi:hypothetical protein